MWTKKRRRKILEARKVGGGPIKEGVRETDTSVEDEEQKTRKGPGAGQKE